MIYSYTILWYSYTDIIKSGVCLKNDIHFLSIDYPEDFIKNLL